MIASLALRYFRNHHNLHISTDGAPFIFIQGPNGVGKTNVLEAISMLTPGRGLKNARNEEILSNAQTESYSWAVEAKTSGFVGLTGAEVHPGKASRRIFRINDQPVSKHWQLMGRLRIIWLTPQTDGVFLSSPSDRRKFWDRMAYNLSQEHAAHVTQYEHFAQSRNKLLQSERVDTVWLKRLETQLAEAAQKVIEGRFNAVQIINRYLQADQQFLSPILNINGEIAAAYNAQQNFVKWFATALERNRKVDTAMGRMKLSASKMDLEAFHPYKQIAAAHCSTGEQKSLLISLLLAQARAILELYNIVPLILLDDILENLDKTNKELLIETLQQLKAQTWITSTHEYSLMPRGTVKVLL